MADFIPFLFDQSDHNCNKLRWCVSADIKTPFISPLVSSADSECIINRQPSKDLRETYFVLVPSIILSCCRSVVHGLVGQELSVYTRLARLDHYMPARRYPVCRVYTLFLQQVASMLPAYQQTFPDQYQIRDGSRDMQRSALSASHHMLV
jgi:hypothetical protein